MIHDLQVSLLHKQKKIMLQPDITPCLEALGTGTAPRKNGACPDFVSPNQLSFPNGNGTQRKFKSRFQKGGHGWRFTCLLKVWRFQWITNWQKQYWVVDIIYITISQAWKKNPPSNVGAVHFPFQVFDSWTLRVQFWFTCFCQHAMPVFIGQRSSLHSSTNSNSCKKSYNQKHTP